MKPQAFLAKLRTAGYKTKVTPLTDTAAPGTIQPRYHAKYIAIYKKNGHIIAITGHSAASVQMIMKHYLTLNSAMAADAIGKLVAWLEKEGVRA